MAHSRNQSISTGGHGRKQSISTGGHGRSQSISSGAPHSVSLKVLRLSKPSLSTSTPLPGDTPLSRASLPYPSAPNTAFPLSPLLTLPPAFGLAYVGTTFACTLCANNEVSPSTPSTTIRDVTLSADLQTPSGSTALTLEGSTASDTDTATTPSPLPPAHTLQKIVRHDLREDGPHVLAVTVSYLETRAPAVAPLKRTFRKLYQFVAQPAIGVRTKMGELAPSARKTTTTAAAAAGRRKFVLEAQLENLTESTVVLEGAEVSVGQGLKSRALDLQASKQILSPLDVVQVAFVLDQIDGAEVEEKGGRVVLAQLVVQWSGPMGEKGDITTGWLGCRGR